MCKQERYRSYRLRMNRQMHVNVNVLSAHECCWLQIVGHVVETLPQNMLTVSRYTQI